MKLPIDVIFRDNYCFLPGEFKEPTFVVDSTVGCVVFATETSFISNYELAAIAHFKTVKTMEKAAVPSINEKALPIQADAKPINPLTGSYESITAINCKLLLAARGLAAESAK